MITDRPIQDILAQGQAPEKWLEEICQNEDAPEKARLTLALTSAKTLYGDKRIEHLQAFLLNHAVSCAALVNALGLLNDAVIATLLFQLPYLKSDWRIWAELNFGKPAAELIEAVHQLQMLTTLVHIDSPDVKHLATNQAEVFRKMLLAMAHDIRVVVIHLAWQAQLVTSLSSATDVHFQRRSAQAALWIFAPLADRLGIRQMQVLLEDEGLRYLHPKAYQDILGLLATHQKNADAYVKGAISLLKTHLLQAGLRIEVTGRPKHLFSIWKKMQQKQLDFTDLYDLFAVRVLVPSLADCYAALGFIQNLWPPIEGRFHDYIAQPKPNHYQSLHIAVKGPEDRILEIQIRTFAMHEQAELGMASHWRYKEGGVPEAQYEKKIAWLRQLLGWQNEFFDRANGEALRDFKTDLFTDFIYTITPTGYVVALPKGATPIDFAYALHTDLGHRCRGAKVNGSLVPLSTTLQNGQCVEIFTHKVGSPSLDWLRAGWVKSTRAIHKIRHYIRQQNTENTKRCGKALFEKWQVQRAGESINLPQMIEKLGFVDLEGCYLALGQNKLSLTALDRAYENPQTATPLVEDLLSLTSASESSLCNEGVLIAGLNNLSVSFAKCCSPVPPDDIIGFVAKGQGASIHRQNCPMLQALKNRYPERILTARFSSVSQRALFTVNLKIVAKDRMGLLQDIAKALTFLKLNIVAFETVTQKKESEFVLRLNIHHGNELKAALDALQKVDGVLLAARQ